MLRVLTQLVYDLSQVMTVGRLAFVDGIGHDGTDLLRKLRRGVNQRQRWLSPRRLHIRLTARQGARAVGSHVPPIRPICRARAALRWQVRVVQMAHQAGSVRA